MYTVEGLNHLIASPSAQCEKGGHMNRTDKEFLMFLTFSFGISVHVPTDEVLQVLLDLRDLRDFDSDNLVWWMKLCIPQPFVLMKNKICHWRKGNPSGLLG